MLLNNTIFKLKIMDGELFYFKLTKLKFISVK